MLKILLNTSVILAFVLVCQLSKVGYPIPWESNGGTLEPVGSYEGVSLRKIAVQDGFLFATDYDGHKLYAFDVTDPSSPALLTTEDLPELVWDVKASGEWPGIYVYLLGRHGKCFKLLIYEFDADRDLRRVGSYDQLVNPWDVCIRGSYAYIADDSGGLKVIDVSDPSRPYEVGRYKGCFPETVDLSYPYAVVSEWEGHIEILDISDPRNPYKIGSYEAETSGYDVTQVLDVVISGSYAFFIFSGAMQHHDFIFVLDISKLSEVFSWVPPTDYITDVAVTDDYFFLCGDGYIEIDDISDIDIGKIRGVRHYYSREARYRYIGISGDHIYITTSSGLYIFNQKSLTAVKSSTWGEMKARFK